MMSKVSIDDLVAPFGSVQAAAVAFGVKSPQVISNWKRRGQVSLSKVFDVEKATGVSRYELRPDVFGTVPEPAE